ncbi:3-hydroxyisobutyrate dehydrogenase-like beta-hydroxyacid dehydrogenase [Actinorugispora endophytica]|uniref:3-hydroxyisobutyrate dehydrogenase-like beta-hydroxyacid dehydrogenase n=2 Tax=Actinorugispora endophytica TaxID=1605990 RepID=A0A4R6V2P1_9ACTN|nr:NAD(P)-dependent oxidoreductase [Actinorugispora endophytica]TDQ54444.1 3-hydroxyisobutyrate dehydrogenase-like beta-hydroxyacid dehydrogenase [Actinorugispora endophytica]
MSPPEPTIGLLHPGSMGAAVGAQLRRRGHTVLWCVEGRSERTRLRAREAGLLPGTDFSSLLGQADVVISLCPPAAAEDVARKVAAHGFSGDVYLEANAVTPEKVRSVSRLLPTTTVVDGAVIGSPPANGKRPSLYLSGDPVKTASVKALFSGTDVKPLVVGDLPGQASALKLSYSSFQKASRVLAALAYALAAEHGVEAELLDVARKRSGSYLAETDYIPITAARAWRWGPELLEAADLLAEASLPDEVMRAAASALSNWEECKDQADLSLTQAIAALRTGI